MLAIATNLPELAIVVSASLVGNVEVAVGNILGGIAIQTVVLVALDAFGVRGRRPLTYRAASLVLVLEAALVVAVLAVVIAGSQLPSSLVVLTISTRTGPGSLTARPTASGGVCWPLGRTRTDGWGGRNVGW